MWSSSFRQRALLSAYCLSRTSFRATAAFSFSTTRGPRNSAHECEPAVTGTAAGIHKFRLLSFKPDTTAGPHSRTSQRCMSSSAYGNEQPGDGTLGLSELSYIPYETNLNWNKKNGLIRNTSLNKNRSSSIGVKVQVGPFASSDWQAGMDLLNLMLREGRSWPFDKEFETMDAYRGYFLSHAACCVRTAEPITISTNNEDEDENTTNLIPEGTLMGCFYIKPNYPGRCSHICNGGFITSPEFRNMGVARLMGQIFLRVAKDLNYKSAYFNLVFQSNVASVALWESLGFQRVAVLENAANLKGIDRLDTAYGYRYDLETLEDDFLPSLPLPPPPI